MIYCVFVGAFKDKRLSQITLEFRQRLDRLWPVTLVELGEKTKELSSFLEKKKNKGILASLDPDGEKMDSPSFTRWVIQSPKDIYFLAWGASGPPSEISKAGMRSLSLSPMTYSHELARVLLLEQLYRAGAVLKGHPYPK